VRVWFPTIRARSGSDVYTERLCAALLERGVDAQLQWFPAKYELTPQALLGVTPPQGTHLIHANSWNGFAFSRRNIPLVLTAFHCVYRNGYPQWKSAAQAAYHNHLIGRYERWGFKKANAVVFMTPSAGADFQARFVLSETALIHGWVDTDVFRPAAPTIHHDGRTRILIVGNGSKRKGFDLIPELSTLLGDRFIITVVGGLRGGVTPYGNGIMHRQGLTLAELVEAYRASDIVLSLSRYEGFGYSALEAMACGKPVVAFDAVGIRDVVAHGITGLLTAVDDVHGIAQHCMTLAADRDRAKQMGLQGRLRALNQFSQKTATDDYIALYQRIRGAA